MCKKQADEWGKGWRGGFRFAGPTGLQLPVKADGLAQRGREVDLPPLAAAVLYVPGAKRPQPGEKAQ